MRNIHSYFVVGALLLTACSSGGIDGEYTDKAGVDVWKFKPNGKVEITFSAQGMTQTTEFDYQVEDGKIKVGKAGGPQDVMPIDRDGCFKTNVHFAGKMCKKK